MRHAATARRILTSGWRKISKFSPVAAFRRCFGKDIEVEQDPLLRKTERMPRRNTTSRRYHNRKRSYFGQHDASGDDVAILINPFDDYYDAMSHK